LLLENSFHRHAPDGLSKAQRARLEQAYLAERPDDPGAWFDGWSDFLGQQQPETKPEPAAPQEPPKPKAFDRGAPASPPGSDESDNPLHWTPAHVDRIVASAKTRAEGQRAVRDQLLAGLKGIPWGRSQ